MPLPPCEPGGPRPGDLAASIAGWVASAPLRELVEHFGGSVPAGAAGAVLDALAEFSSVWDFRGGTKERFDTDRVHYEPAVDAWVRERIHALGLGGLPPAHPSYDHVIVLGGGIRVALGRSDFTARLLAGGVTAGTVAGLGSLRRRDDREHREALRLGLGVVETEADMMAVALRRFLALGDAAKESSGDGWWHRVWAAQPEVHVLAAASTRPPLRANTACTLLGWAEHVHAPAPGERVLLITNDPYARHQHCDAVRLLGLRFGCGIETISMDDRATAEWGRPLSTTELLQEVRSSILATRNLYAVVA
jgi:hypothetical protein